MSPFSGARLPGIPPAQTGAEETGASTLWTPGSPVIHSPPKTVRIEVPEPDGSTVTMMADYAWTGGQGHPVVMLHAIGLGRISWEWVLPTVAERGPAWSFDLLGFGE